VRAAGRAVALLRDFFHQGRARRARCKSVSRFITPPPRWCRLSDQSVWEAHWKRQALVAPSASFHRYDADLMGTQFP
jgi:hypothetical protein